MPTSLCSPYSYPSDCYQETGRKSPLLTPLTRTVNVEEEVERLEEEIKRVAPDDGSYKVHFTRPGSYRFSR